jgi:ATP-dependent helicase HrpB
MLCAMAGQRRAMLDARSVARQTQAMVAVDVRELAAGQQGVRTVLSLASAIDVRWLEWLHPERIQARLTTSWNAAEAAVEQHEEWLYDGLVYHRERAAQVDPAAAAPLLVDRIRAGEVRLDRWDRQVEQWVCRTRLVARLFPERGLPTYTDEDLKAVLHRIVAGATRAAHLRGRQCLGPVRAALRGDQQRFVEQMAPARLLLPTGQHLRLQYRLDEPPRGQARIQELYGVEQTPTIAGGRQRLVLEILGPNLRPVQITDDLAGFWRVTYPALKPALRRRYPRHEWR